MLLSVVTGTAAVSQVIVVWAAFRSASNGAAHFGMQAEIESHAHVQHLYVYIYIYIYIYICIINII